MIFTQTQTTLAFTHSQPQEHRFIKSNEAFILKRCFIDSPQETFCEQTFGCFSMEEPWLAGLIELSRCLLLSDGETHTDVALETERAHRPQTEFDQITRGSAGITLTY